MIAQCCLAECKDQEECRGLDSPSAGQKGSRDNVMSTHDMGRGRDTR